MERDFLVDFLGVFERDRLDRLGVRGEGDLVGSTGRRIRVEPVPKHTALRQQTVS